MRALALSIVVLVATPTLALAQGHTAISRNPASTQPPAAEPVRPVRDDAFERRERRRGRPVVIVDAPYGGYERRIGGRFDGLSYGSSNTVYTGTYGGLAPAAPAARDTTWVAFVPYVPAERATRDETMVAASPAALSLAVERVGGSMLRVRWTGRDPNARAVTLVVADASRRVIAAQTLRVAPYSAVFDDRARVAFVGTTAVTADGASTTTLVPVGRVRGPAARKPLPPIVRTP